MEIIIIGCCVSVIITIIASIASYIMIKKQKGVFSQLMNSGEEEERKGNDQAAIVLYKHALAIILGLEKGSTKLTVKGVGLLMEEDGKKAIERIDGLYNKNEIQHSWDELNALVAEFENMSSNKELVDKYGIPKGAGKELFMLLSEKLRRCINSLPEINMPTNTPVPVVSQSGVPLQHSVAPISPSASIPTAEEYVAKNIAAKKRGRKIVWSIIIGLILCVCLLMMFPFFSY